MTVFPVLGVLLLLIKLSCPASASLSKLCTAVPHQLPPGQPLTVIEAEAWRQAQALAASPNDQRACQLQCELLTELSRTRRVLSHVAPQAAWYLCQAHRLGACCQHEQALLREHGHVVKALATQDCTADKQTRSLETLCQAVTTEQQHHQRHQQQAHAFDAIVSVTEWEKVFVAHALPYALMTIADLLGAELHVLSRPHWSKMACGGWWARLWSGSARAELRSQLQGKRVLVVLDAAYLQGCQPISQLKSQIFGENSKFLVLGGDTVYRNATSFCEWSQCWETDMFLDLLDGAAVGFHLRHGVPTGTWMWTPSNTFLKVLHGFAHLTRNVSRSPTTVTMFMRITGYPFRESLKQTLQAANYTVHGGLDPSAGTLPNIFMLYKQSVATIGSTSSSVPWSNCRSMKGFRDWIGPPLGAVLVYDNHPDILRKYVHVPTHQHGNMTDLLLLLRREDVGHIGSEQRHRLLVQQQQWLAKNLLDWQLVYYIKQLAAVSGGAPMDNVSIDIPASSHERLPGWVLPTNASVPLDGCVADPPNPFV